METLILEKKYIKKCLKTNDQIQYLQYIFCDRTSNLTEFQILSTELQIGSSVKNV